MFSIHFIKRDAQLGSQPKSGNSHFVLLCQSGILLFTGVNAARRAQDLATVVIPRDSSYLGTLVDDLVTKVAPPNCLAVHCLASAVSDGSAAAD